MERPQEVVRTISIPENTGVQGFLRTIEEIIKMPRVQRVIIEAQGTITYRRFVTEGEETEPENFNVDLTNLQPHHIIRNTEVEELAYINGSAAPTVVGTMLDRVAVRNLTPIAFVTGTASSLSSWYFYTAGTELQVKDRLFGYPLYKDRAIPDTTLVLCAGYGYTHALVDTRYSVKVEIPVRAVLSENLEVL